MVTLSQYIQGKKFTVARINNTGGKPLFDFLTDCLAGDFDIAKLDRPNKILLLTQADEADGKYVISRATDTGFIYLTAKPEKIYTDDNKSGIRYSFIIPQDIFIGTKFNAVGLYPWSATLSDAEEDYAAYCYLGEEVLDDISVSAILVLDWELYISNQ
jgi:hypothetical protein